MCIDLQYDYLTWKAKISKHLFNISLRVLDYINNDYSDALLERSLTARF